MRDSSRPADPGEAAPGAAGPGQPGPGAHRPGSAVRPDRSAGPPAVDAPGPRRRRPSVPAALAGAVVLAQIAYPLTPVGAARDRLTAATVLLFAAASVLHAATSRGGRAAVALVVVAGGGGLLVEAVGVATGVPFGGTPTPARSGRPCSACRW